MSFKDNPNLKIVWYEDLTADKSSIKELISDEVPLRPAKVETEEGQTMSKLELLGEMHAGFQHSLHGVDALREASEAIEWLLLPVHVVDDVVSCLEDASIVDLCLRYCGSHSAIRPDFKRMEIVGQPALVGWDDTLVYEKLDR